MAHPYKDRDVGGRKTARNRYADGGRSIDLNSFHLDVARKWNDASRKLGLPYNKGAVGVQQNADMVEADQVSDAVPRKGLKMEPAR